MNASVECLLPAKTSPSLFRFAPSPPGLDRAPRIWRRRQRSPYLKGFQRKPFTRPQFQGRS